MSARDDDDDVAAELDDADGGDEGEGDESSAASVAGVHTLVIEQADAGMRLDALIAARVANISRALVQKLVDDGQVTLAGRVTTKPSARVKDRDTVVVVVPPPTILEAVAEDIPLVILHEDADLIVIDKPSGMVVHPAAGHPRGTLVNALLFHCTDLSGIGGVLRPGIVHRLDKDTTGVMVATKSDRAHAALSAQFAAKSRGEGSKDSGIDRTYLAITSPPPPDASGTLRTLYGRHRNDRKKFTSKIGTGKSAVTHYEVLEALAGAALVKFRLETGRTHQIRVHAADHGWPLLGDLTYGKRSTVPRLSAVGDTLGRQALHAHTLTFDHPITKLRMSFTSPLPPDLVAARAALVD